MVDGRRPTSRQGGRGHGAPAVADDLKVDRVQAGGPDEGRHVGGIVAEAMVADPRSRPTVAREIDRDDMTPGGRQGGADAATTRRPTT